MLVPVQQRAMCCEAACLSPCNSHIAVLECDEQQTERAWYKAASQSQSAGRFLDESGDEKEVEKKRHGAFKIIPRITEGGWVVKQAVGQNTPVLLGRKLTTKYFRCRSADRRGSAMLPHMTS
jgi:hypothetical protein